VAGGRGGETGVSCARAQGEREGKERKGKGKEKRRGGQRSLRLRPVAAPCASSRVRGRSRRVLGERPGRFPRVR